MDRPRQNDHLGVNKTGKNIRKSPLHQPNFPAANASANANAAAVPRPQGQPQVYNISKNDFRSIVQQLTGSPSRESLPRPPPNSSSPKPQSTRLQRIRPPPLTQISPPAVPPPTMAPIQHRPHGGFVRPPPPQTHFPQGTQQQQQQPMMGQGDQFWSNTAESPISGYMRYLQSSLGDAGPNGNQMQPGPEHRPYMPAQSQPQPYMPAQSQRHQPYMAAQSQPQPYMPAQAQSQPQAQPQPHMMPGSQPHMNMQGPLPPPGLVPSPVPRNFPSQPQFNGPVPVTPTLPSPRFNQMYGGFPSPRYNGFGPLNSPTSQFAPQSPTGYPNMFGPRSPYPLLSPGGQYPQPLTPNFSFSQLAQSGNHGPGAAGSGLPQPPPSPGLMFPLSPGFFQNPSPRWGNY
ncbi:Protein HAIKU1 [Raphanus sativus]|uniref:Protein HAIKU1 n=1 Tax=Raphanus sativus TaxID=3726 RepID=A0A6J0K4I1_RAPSA|nr:protein HAIKU1 [Raphanus sativus]KAJ4891688.1 Protein HAIKU1 [Raphanus sativus]